MKSKDSIKYNEILFQTFAYLTIQYTWMWPQCLYKNQIDCQIISAPWKKNFQKSGKWAFSPSE